ncbi:MAG: hypothetical protein FRX49_00276 [Trebouxia sp. A1-2]|nr:MAG: hypothetical protein FRX49_00276 [Trebouxia sp. A1-2]
MDEFGAKLDADCDELFKQALQESLPATFNVLERTAVKRLSKHPGANMVDKVYINQDADPYVLEMDSTLDLAGLNLQPASIVINRKRGLVDAQTSKTKRTFAHIQQNVLHNFVAGSMDQPLQIAGVPVAVAPKPFLWLRAVLLIAFVNGATPVLCKFTAEQQAVVHEFEVLEDLWQQPAVPGIVGPVRLLKANPAGRSHGHVAAPGAAVLRVKHCLQMPVYPATLQHIPAPIQESVILTFGRQLKTSLQNVHQKGYGHNDVKAANIFISATGEREPIA